MLDADLKEFEDYISEFNSVPQFDSETCPICGISLSDNLSAIYILKEKGIKSKQSSQGKEKILIPEEKLEDVKSILRS